MEISNREELKRIIKSERSYYLSSKGWYQEFLKIVKSHPDYNAWLYTKQLRRTSYYYSKRNRNPFNLQTPGNGASAQRLQKWCRQSDFLADKGLSCSEHTITRFAGTA